jgi:hypothetical protein
MILIYIPINNSYKYVYSFDKFHYYRETWEIQTPTGLLSGTEWQGIICSFIFYGLVNLTHMYVF